MTDLNAHPEGQGNVSDLIERLRGIAAMGGYTVAGEAADALESLKSINEKLTARNVKNEGLLDFAGEKIQKLQAELAGERRMRESAEGAVRGAVDILGCDAGWKAKFEAAREWAKTLPLPIEVFDMEIAAKQKEKGA